MQIQDRSPREILIDQQFNMVEAIMKFRRSSRCIGVPTMAWWTEFAGYFWKNPRVIEDSNMIAGVLQRMSLGSFRCWLPQLEPWLIRHAAAPPDNASRLEEIFAVHDYVEDDEGREFPDYIRFTLSHGNSKGLYIGGKFVSPGSELLGWRETTMGEEDINSSPHWWCFHYMSDSHRYSDLHGDSLWTFVNYEEKRMYEGRLFGVFGFGMTLGARARGGQEKIDLD
jgi:hypothetical protein